MGWFFNIGEILVGIGIGVLSFVGVPVDVPPSCTVSLSETQISWTAEPGKKGGGVATLYSGDFDALIRNNISKIRADISANGNASFTIQYGFLANAATANRVCAAIFPGSASGSINADSYKSPGNNSILLWTGSVWQKQGAASTNSRGHLRGHFTCVDHTPETMAVTITSSTDSPSVPGKTVRGTVRSRAFAGVFGTFLNNYRSKILADVRAHGVPNASLDGFYADQRTADRLCAAAFPGSVANSNYGSDSYTSPGNNTVLVWNGSSWKQHSARRYNKHLRSTFGCLYPAQSVQSTSGKYTFSPSLSAGTHRYSVIVQSPGGTKTCQASVIVPPFVTDDETKNAENDADNASGGNANGNAAGSTSGDISNDTESESLPECSDGRDNNGNGAADYPEDRACSSPDDEFEEPLPPAVLTVKATPALVKQNTTANISWNAENIEPDSCLIEGANGDVWTLVGTSGTQSTSPLNFETDFTLSCIDLNGAAVSAQVTVKLAPSFNEI